MNHTVTHEHGSVTLRIVDGVPSHSVNRGRDFRPGWPHYVASDHAMKRARATVLQKYQEAIGFKRIPVRNGASNKTKLVRA